MVLVASVVQLVVLLLLVYLLTPRQHTSSPSLPLVVTTRADLETVKRMMKGDTYIGRGCKQRGLPGVCLEIRTNSVITAERKQWPSIDNSSTIRLNSAVS